MFIYICLYTYVHIHIYVYIYIYQNIGKRNTDVSQENHGKPSHGQFSTAILLCWKVSNHCWIPNLADSAQQLHRIPGVRGQCP